MNHLISALQALIKQARDVDTEMNEGGEWFRPEPLETMVAHLTHYGDDFLRIVRGFEQISTLLWPPYGPPPEPTAELASSLIEHLTRARPTPRFQHRPNIIIPDFLRGPNWHDFSTREHSSGRMACHLVAPSEALIVWVAPEEVRDRPNDEPRFTVKHAITDEDWEPTGGGQVLYQGEDEAIAQSVLTAFLAGRRSITRFVEGDSRT